MPPPHHDHDHHHHHGHHHPHDHHKDPSKYDDYDWDELPPHLQEAAKVLNWTPKLWDEDGKPDTEDKGWHDLTHEQRKAAEQFGYHPKLWDEGHHHPAPPHGHHHHEHHHHAPPHEKPSDEKKPEPEEKKDDEEEVDADIGNLNVNDGDEAYETDEDKKEEQQSSETKEEKKKKKQAMFKTSKLFGGYGGEKFDHGNNRHISKIVVYDNGHVVTGLEVNYTNATQKVGKTNGKGTTFELERGEFITSATIRHNMFVQSLGFKTNKGKVLEPVGGKGWSKIDLRGKDTEGEEVKVNAPIKYQLCGFVGRAGSYVDQLGFRWGPVPNVNKKQ